MRPYLRRIAAFVLAAVAAGGIAMSQAMPAADAASTTLGMRVLAMAETRHGDPYYYGGAGPSAFDCSGLVYWAAREEGIALPRTSQSMPSSRYLKRVSMPEPGDLAFFWNDAHVEIVLDPRMHETFGAHDSGSVVSQISWGASWPPGTAFYALES
jgi:cell wall-associated NlpC family hydrolase